MVPTIYFDYASVVADYGALSLTNTLTLGAYLAFEQGATQLICVQAVNNTYSDFQAAIDQLALPIAGINPYYIIPLTSTLDPVIAEQVRSYTQQHIDTMSNPVNKKERVARFGYETTKASIDLIALAQKWHDERIKVMAPSVWMKTLTIDGVTSSVALDGSFFAVIDSAKDSILASYESMINKPFLNIDSVPVLSDGLMNLMAAAGLTIVVLDNGSYVERDDLTTDMTNYNTQSPNIVKIKDAVILDVRASAKPFIGVPLVPSVPASLENAINSTLTKQIPLNRISRFVPAKAVQSALEPRQINASFGILPTYTTLWIYVTWTINNGLLS